MPYLGNIPATQFAELKYQDFTGGTGTSFTLNDPVGSAQELEVFVNNVRQEPGVAYTVSGTALTMTGSIVASDDFYVVFQGKSTGTATHPAGQALTATDGTFTGDLTVDTNTLFVDSTNNSVGIGTTSPSTSHRLTLDKSSNYGGIQLKQSGTQIGQIIQEGGTGNVYIDADSAGTGGSLILRTNGGTEISRVTSNGLTFNGDTADANALDDYEEGTWTPAFTSTGASFSYSTQTGSYTKIGRFVHLIFDLRLNATPTGTLSNSVKISGIPFTAGGMSGFFGGAIGHYFNINLQSSRTELVYQLSNGATVSELKQSGDNQSDANCLASDLSSSTQIRGSMTYFQQ